MSETLEGRIDAKIAALRSGYDRRILLTSFAACFVVTVAFFVFFPPQILTRMTPPSRAAFTLIGIPGVSLLYYLIVRILVTPFLDIYYALFRKRSHVELAVAQVVAEELSARKPGYLQTVSSLLSTHEPRPAVVFPEASRAFDLLLEAGEPREALELAERLGLPKSISNRARRMVMADWKSAGEPAPEIRQARQAVEDLMQDYESIEGLMTAILSEDVVNKVQMKQLLDSYGWKLDSLESLTSEAIREVFPALTTRRLARIFTAIGRAHASLDDRYRARHYLERAIEIDPGSREAYLALSHVHYEQENYLHALAVIEDLLRRDPNDVLAALHRNDCVRRLNRRWLLLRWILSGSS